jgi:hypothetical protein
MSDGRGAESARRLPATWSTIVGFVGGAWDFPGKPEVTAA